MARTRTRGCWRPRPSCRGSPWFTPTPPFSCSSRAESTGWRCVRGAGGLFRCRPINTLRITALFRDLCDHWRELVAAANVLLSFTGVEEKKSLQHLLVLLLLSTLTFSPSWQQLPVSFALAPPSFSSGEFPLVLSDSEPLCTVLIGKFEAGLFRIQTLNLSDSHDADGCPSDWSLPDGPLSDWSLSKLGFSLIGLSLIS